MTRRKIELEEESTQQLALALPTPRRRVELGENDCPQVGTVVGTVRGGKCVSIDSAQSRADAMQQEMESDPYTLWSSVRPPSSGWWDVKQKSAREGAAVRMHYMPDLDKWAKAAPAEGGYKDSKDARFIPHTELMQSHQWRGLRLRPVDAYTSFVFVQTPPVMLAPHFDKLPEGDKDELKRFGKFLRDARNTTPERAYAKNYPQRRKVEV